MTGTDDEGFRPYPGDPWHPEWSKDAEPGDTPPPESASDEPDDDAKKPRRRGLFGRRRERRSDEPEPADTGEEPDDSQYAEAPSTGEYDLEDDPFEQVLRAEGRSVRRRSNTDEQGPAPEWTADEEPSEEPQWFAPEPVDDPAVGGFAPIGTDTDSGETIGFQSATPSDDDDEDDDVLQEDLFGGDDPASEPDDVAMPQPDQEPALAESDEEPVLPEPDWEPALPEPDEEPALPEPDEPGLEQPIVGEYGVAGPEAFGALADTEEEDLGEWEAFAGGSVHPDPVVPPAPTPPSDLVGDAEDFDQWTEPDEPTENKKRGWFRRRRDRAESDDWEPDADEAVQTWEQPEPADEWSVEQWDAEGEAAPEPVSLDHSAFMPPTDDVPEVLDEALGEPAENEEEDEAAAVAAALAALGVEDDVDDDLLTDVAPPSDDVIEPLPEPEPLSEPEPLPEPEALLEPEPLPEPEPMSEPEPVVWGPEEPRSGDRAAADVDDDEVVVADEPVDWQGAGGPVPAGWLSDIDEDEVTPPPAADTPETEWPVVPDDGRWEGQAAWERPQPDVFDQETVEASAQPEITPEPAIEVPEGFEDWESAVTDATALEDEETAEYHVQHITPPADALPAGFEQFPGDRGEPRPDEPMMGSAEEDDWMDDSRDVAGLPTEEMDGPYVPDEARPGFDDPDFDERAYATGGTIEHRGLAEAIAAAGDDEDTEWQAMSAAMPGLETGVLGFEDVADLAGDEEYVAPLRSNLGMRVLTGLILFGLLFGSLLVGGWAFAIFVGLLVLLGLTELYATLRRVGFLPLSLFGLLGAAGTLLATWFHGPMAIPSGVMLTAVATFFFYAFAPTRRDALSNAGLTVLGMAWVAGGVAFAIPIARAPEFEILVLAVVAVTAAMDIGAYSFGRTWGRRPLAPVLSPNKTIEGLVGGTIIALAAAGALGWFEMGPFDLRSGLALGAVVVVAAPLGDLAESMLKRTMGVKDMGSTLPGHGGILDRIDALVFVIPSAWVLLEILGLLG